VVTRDHPGKVIERPGCSVRINFVWITTLKSLVFVVSVNGSEWNAGERSQLIKPSATVLFPTLPVLCVHRINRRVTGGLAVFVSALVVI